MIQSDLFTTDSFVVMVGTNANDRTISIAYCSVLSLCKTLEKLDKEGANHIIYYKLYNNHIEALGHKFLLKNFNLPTLKRFIMHRNPHQQNYFDELLAAAQCIHRNL